MNIVIGHLQSKTIASTQVPVGRMIVRSRDLRLPADLECLPTTSSVAIVTPLQWRSQDVEVARAPMSSSVAYALWNMFSSQSALS